MRQLSWHDCAYKGPREPVLVVSNTWPDIWIIWKFVLGRSNLQRHQRSKKSQRVSWNGTALWQEYLQKANMQVDSNVLVKYWSEWLYVREVMLTFLWCQVKKKGCLVFELSNFNLLSAPALLLKKAVFLGKQIRMWATLRRVYFPKYCCLSALPIVIWSRVFRLAVK